ncbi:MAG: flavodoxin family protein [Bacteroidales bacterium]|nr:flavodoxin family protein [Bacteroidales bacterium]MDD4384696.1 flavodoxin family protein [Bacteroidales bacterium]MDY0196190.1 flavodoxin family protein [Tenuifilaceae bacterium]
MDEKSCIYYGKVDGPLAQIADIIFVGFWVYKGSCAEEIKQKFKTLQNKKIVLFGTAGFGGSEDYYETIIQEVKQLVPKSNIIIDSFMCQGKMPQNVFERYEKLLKAQPENSNILNMIFNYKSALSHLDKHDIEAAKTFARSYYS